MSQKKKFVKKQANIYRSLIAAALVVNGIFQFVAPVLAEGSAGGESISNTATATYEDPNNPGETINTTSNTVVVTVAEVAGVTVVGSGTEFADEDDGAGGITPGDTNGDGKINTGDKIYYNYTVTNVGNDPTKVRIPDQPNVTGPATLDGDVEISYDGGTTWVPVAQGGTITDSIDPDESILVRVPVKVENGAQSGDKITVKLGETPGDDQNIPRSSDGGDVYTVDNPDGTGQGPDNAGNTEVDGTPANGVREASATQEVTVDSDLKTYTLAKILKTRSDHTVAGADGPQDDTVTYDLSLEVENTDPTGQGLTPAPLEGAAISVDGNPGNYILVSDAIPVGTQLDNVVAPSGWQVVYTDDPVGTTTNATKADWTTNLGSLTGPVTRVGFVRTTSVAPGQTVNGFKVTVKVTSPDNKVIVANMAQLFGESPSGNDVYDESGDNNPSNYDPDTQLFPGTNTPGELPPDGLPDGEIDDGSIDPTDNDNNNIPDEAETLGVDTQNNNTGTGENGEVNIFTIEKAGDVSLLTGPQGAPDAVAENDNNKDFTNKSSLVPFGTEPNSTIDPDGVSFTNTVKNTGIAPADITLLPTETALANAGDLPDGTLVTISYQSQSATYEYNGGAFVGPGGGALPTPVVIPGVAPDATDDYGVEVNLPPNTELSTDIEKGFPTPIVAFVDDANGTFEGTEPNNITIDRVYTGFLKMVKESRVIKSTGPDVVPGEETFSVTPKSPAPGNILEYRITYKNISEAQSGTNNVILNASDIEITEDGTLSTAPGDGLNNWALDNDGNGEIDTSNITGSATDSGNANILFSPSGDQTGTTGATDVTKYVVTVSDDVAPQEERTFTFQRRINDTGLTGN